MKVYKAASLATAELKMEYLDEIDRDGVRTETEQRILSLIDRAYVFTEASAWFAEMGQRLSGGGAMDERALQQWAEIKQLLAELEGETIRPMPIPVGGITLFDKEELFDEAA